MEFLVEFEVETRPLTICKSAGQPPCAVLEPHRPPGGPPDPGPPPTAPVTSKSPLTRALLSIRPSWPRR
jgi:hypothetical protein